MCKTNLLRLLHKAIDHFHARRPGDKAGLREERAVSSVSYKEFYDSGCSSLAPCFRSILATSVLLIDAKASKFSEIDFHISRRKVTDRF